MTRCAVLALALVSISTASCVGDERASDWVDEMKEANAQADRAEASADREAAIEALRRALARPAPPEVAPSDEHAVRADLSSRIAENELGLGHAEAAVTAASHALDEADGAHDDVFAANLLIVRGRAEEALGRDLEAADDYYAALQIDDRLLGAAIGGTR